MASYEYTDTIEDYFRANWTTTPIKFDGVPYTPVQGTSFVKLEVWDGKSIAASIGSPVKLRRTQATAFVQIYTPGDKGSKPARLLADQVTSLFRDLELGSPSDPKGHITFEEGDIMKVGEKYYASAGTTLNATGQWYEMMVALPFRHDIYI
jgi:hypothetical protein